VVLDDAQAPKLTFCLSEDREGMEPGVRLAIYSICRHCPGAEVVVYRADPTASFVEWVEQFPDVVLIPHAPIGGTSWNCKPHALLPLLREGRREVVWLDSDVLITRDPRALFASCREPDVGVCEEYRGAPDPGSELRTRGWNLPVGRSFPRTLNSAVLRVTPSHIPLLERWHELLNDPQYVHWQASAFDDRPIHCWGDQDILNALLGSSEFADVPVKIFKTGRDVIHCVSYTSFPVFERLASVLRPRPPFVHVQGEKPWVVLRPDLKAHFSRSRRLKQELSPYRLLARAYGEAADVDGSWLSDASAVGRSLCWLGFGHFALAGLPLAALAAIGKRVR
jgi:hypothetical protein